MTPDLDTRVESPSLSRAVITALIRESASDGSMLPIGARRRWTLKGRELIEGSVYMNSLHDYLTDEADWGAPTWVFESEGLVRLDRSLRLVFARMPHPLTFQAVWIGDPIESEQPVTRDALLELVAENRIETRTRYLVAAAAAESA